MPVCNRFPLNSASYHSIVIPAGAEPVILAVILAVVFGQIATSLAVKSKKVRVVPISVIPSPPLVAPFGGKLDT